MRLAPEAAADWKQRILTRESGLSTLSTVRAFYLDIAQWAMEEPSRWGPWSASCPIRAEEMSRTKTHRRRKSRMDQRTRDRLPVLPDLLTAVNTQRRAAAEQLQAACATPPGKVFSAAGHTLRRTQLARPEEAAKTWAEDPDTGVRRDLTLAEHQAFWAWTVVEVLRHTGLRVEELCELSHHSFVQYTLPSTGELIPLLHVAPSKTDAERLLVISPELADVLSAIVCRIRDDTGAVPLVAAYDYHEKIWNPLMPLLLQRHYGGERRPITPPAIRRLLNWALEKTGFTDATGKPLTFLPHDFRRIFITDAVMNGMPPHIAQLVVGHRDINTTMGYKAVYPEEVINGHRASHAASPYVLARNTEPQPTKNGTISSATSNDAKSHSELADAPTTHPASTNTPAYAARSCAPTQPNEPDCSRSTTTSSSASTKPNNKAGSAKSTASPPASPAPNTKSHNSTNSTRAPPPSTSECPTSPTSSAATSRHDPKTGQSTRAQRVQITPGAQHPALCLQGPLVSDHQGVAHRLHRTHRRGGRGPLRRVRRRVGRALPSDHPALALVMGTVHAVPSLPPQIRKLIYTTNAVESLNARFRQATRRRGHSPNEQAALKVLYLVIRTPLKGRTNVTGRTTGWKAALNVLAMFYGERITLN